MDNEFNSIPLSEVVDPSAYRALAAAIELATLEENAEAFLTKVTSEDLNSTGDDVLLAAQMDIPSLPRARQILAQSNGLYYLVMETLEAHRKMGLSTLEIARLQVFSAMAARLVDRRTSTESRRLTTAHALADEIAAKSLGWEGERIGIVGIDHRGNRTLDQVLYMGTATNAYASPREIIREVLRRNVVTWVYWHYQPYREPAYDTALKHLVQELRLLGDVTGARLWDALLVGEANALSIRTHEGWAD